MRTLRRTAPFVLLLSLSLLLASCASTKKTTAPEPGKPQVSATTQPISPPIPRGEAEDRVVTPGKEADKEMTRLKAIKGEDVPLSPVPKKEFLEPSTTEKQVLKNIYFDYDKSDIKPEYRSTLETIGQWLKDNPKKQLLLEGHCDERGTNEYNLALGERRALSVRRYLVGLGADAEKLHTISYGEEKPADPGHTEEAWSKNRRAEFKVSAQE